MVHLPESCSGSGTEKLPPRWFWGSIPSPSVASLTSSLPQYYTVAPIGSIASFFQGLIFLRRVQANSSISSNSNKSNPPVPHKPSVTTGPSRPVVHLWSLDPFLRFAVSVLGEKKAKQISILPPERAKRTSKRPSVASFCVAKETEPQQSQRVASYRCCSYFIHWCMCFFGATKERKKGFSLKKSCSR